MADSENSTALPDDGDAELLRLGAAHQVMLRQYEENDPDDTPASELHMNALMALETRIAAIPATTPAGLVVRLWVLWSWECTENGVLFTGPTAEASDKEHLAWGLLQDARRLVAGT